jgi:FKBP-type peptidyl-prolyl cis-trans isomerase
MNKIIIIISVIVVAVIVVGGVFFFIGSSDNKTNSNQPVDSLRNFQIQGMRVDVVREGAGNDAKNGSRVTVNYSGKLSDGREFDSSYKRNSPFTFILGTGKVIKGWDLGVLGMKAGEKRILTIPPELAYGAKGLSSMIPPNSTLTFEVEMLKIN